MVVFRILRETKKSSSRASPWKEEHEEKAVIAAAAAATAVATPTEEADKAGKKGECELGRTFYDVNRNASVNIN